MFCNIEKDQSFEQFQKTPHGAWTWGYNVEGSRASLMHPFGCLEGIWEYTNPSPLYCLLLWIDSNRNSATTQSTYFDWESLWQGRYFWYCNTQVHLNEKRAVLSLHIYAPWGFQISEIKSRQFRVDHVNPYVQWFQNGRRTCKSKLECLVGEKCILGCYEDPFAIVFSVSVVGVVKLEEFEYA